MKINRAQPLALTCGDPAGVGPEIIAAWLRENPDESRHVAVLGAPSWLATLPAGVTRIPIGTPEFSARPGHPDGEGALIAWGAMERAATGCANGEFSGVVTGSISKERLAAIGYAFPGQTEFFAARWGGEPVMAFCGGRLRVVLATWHVPLKNVGAALTPEVLTRSVAAADALARADGIVEPRIAVCGLNPHAGENGLLGDEERVTFNPLLSKLQSRYPRLSLCLPGDTVFGRALTGEFDVVIALYHDQGLAPLKTVDFDESVNVTMGLPFVRTSPDHGTAFGIAGTGKAKITSFANAVTVARRLINARIAQ